MNAAGGRFDTVVFALGGVLIDWSPRHLYRRLFDDEAAMERFLAEVCTQQWNEQQDAGRSWSEAVATLSARYPQHAGLIQAYRARWEEMLGGPMAPSVAVLDELRGRSLRLYALTHWSHETIPVAWERYDFLHWFAGVMVSGEERLTKPDPAIFQRLIARFGLLPQRTIYIDDTPRHVEASRRLDMHGLLFRDALTLRAQLCEAGVLNVMGSGGRGQDDRIRRAAAAGAPAGNPAAPAQSRARLRRRRIRSATTCASWPRGGCASASTTGALPLLGARRAPRSAPAASACIGPKRRPTERMKTPRTDGRCGAFDQTR